ncbi:MAG: DnaB-like helicase C-terminal domain-containing protein, partial [Candidatus Tectomicrobia bacterium]
MYTYHLMDDFTDVMAEQALLACIVRTPSLYWELLDLLTPDVFTKEAETWRAIALAIEAEQSPTIPADWLPAHDPQAAAHRLADLYQRRLLAAAQERIAQALFHDTVPATDIATLLEEEALQVQTALRATAAGPLQWASDLVPQVLADAATRHRQREETGIPVQGVLTGIARLDLLLNGLNDGLLHLLAGPPGMGKTTLAWQIAVHAAQTVPVVYVTCENSPHNLALKGLCAAAGINPLEVQRGWADVERLRRAALAWHPFASRLALVEGSSRLTVAQVRAHALRAMQRHNAPRCVVIVDYLQLWAKMAEDLRGVFQVRERVEMLGGALRELAIRLQSPVIVLSSQNRSAGNYGNGKGSTALDSLKESGDLEYAADVVLFLTEAKERQATAPARALDLTVAKHRHGETGTIALIFRPDLGTLRE